MYKCTVRPRGPFLGKTILLSKFPQILHVPLEEKSGQSDSGYLRPHCWQRISWRMWPSVRTQNLGRRVGTGPQGLKEGLVQKTWKKGKFLRGKYTCHTLSFMDFGDQTWCNDFMKRTWKLTWHAGNSQCSRGNIHLHSWWILHCHARFRGGMEMFGISL